MGGSSNGEAAVVMIELGAGPCSGVLVAPRVALTAAHCLGAGAGEVRVGASAPWAETLPVIARHAHRGYVAGESAFDLALVRLAAPAAHAPSAAHGPSQAATTAAIHARSRNRGSLSRSGVT